MYLVRIEWSVMLRTALRIELNDFRMTGDVYGNHLTDIYKKVDRHYGFKQAEFQEQLPLRN